MALDAGQLLRTLLQGGGTTTLPTSGLREPSLSGLGLGPQGMGFGGGESLMGGGSAGFGRDAGGGLGGLDLDQLLAQLQAASGVTGAGLGTGIGAGSLGAGFGAGGILGEEPSTRALTAGQQGSAGLGATNTTAQLLSLIKEGTGLGKALLRLFPKGPTNTDLQGLNLPDLTAFSPALGSDLSSLEQLSAANPDLFSLTGQVSAIPALDPSRFTGAFGGLAPFNTSGIEALGPGGAPALAGELGPGGLGVPQVSSGILDSLGGVSGVLGGVGTLSNIGLGALDLSQGNIGRGTGSLLGTGTGLALGSFLAPETSGLSLLLGGIGGGAGGLLGGLFGGSGPSENWLSFPSRLSGTIGKEQDALAAFDKAILNAKSPQVISDALVTFQQAIEDAGVGGFTERPQTTWGPEGFQWAEIPGATGVAHEGGLTWDPASFESRVATDIITQLDKFRKLPEFKGWFATHRQPSAVRPKPVAQPFVLPTPWETSGIPSIWESSGKPSIWEA